MTQTHYSTQEVFRGLKETLHSYLEAQYHVWDLSLVRERRLLLQEPGITHTQPFFEATASYKSSGPYDSLDIPSAAKSLLSAAAALPDPPVFAMPFLHQAEAIERFAGKGDDLIVATGTGSGKTESFLLPLLASLAIEAADLPASARLPGVRALLLYPMNALVNDQLTRLRRLFGHAGLSKLLGQPRRRPVRFGMYTGRTPYPGPRLKTTKKEAERLLPKLAPFREASQAIEKALRDAGMWPAKDIERFIANGFSSSADDVELFSRHEIQESPPDLLVTNYSMLEYMLIRPIERPIFDATRAWLESDPNAYFTVVLDEAHMYRGAAGAEVALLLRRLQSRLGIDRARMRFILTSASLGEGPEAIKHVKEFANDLTGGRPGRSYHVITGTQEFYGVGAPATSSHRTALATYDVLLLSEPAFETKRGDVLAATNQLLSALGLKTLAADDAATFRSELFQRLKDFPPVSLLARLITGTPKTFDHIADAVIAPGPDSPQALETLLALCCFARRRDQKVLLPIRMHLLFRGLSGVFACVNRFCSKRLDNSPGAPLLGRLYEEPRFRCGCGARVFEVLTHRDCGATYIRGYVHGVDGTFLWHETGPSLDGSGPALLPIHLLVQKPSQNAEEGRECFLHAFTGLLTTTVPNGKEAEFIPVLRPEGPVSINRASVLSFDRNCPVCCKGWGANTTKIMDLATKGDAPFAHLTKAQVRLQTATKAEDDAFPNGGRKSLLFSDGRQKAARLAHDIPREVEQDVFRQLLLLAVAEADRAGIRECRCNIDLFTAFVHVLDRARLRLFDGEDLRKLTSAVRSYRREHGGNLAEALQQRWESNIPGSYYEALFRQLGHRHYSLAALTLGYPAPTKATLNRLREQFPDNARAEVEAIVLHWLDHALADMALDPRAPAGARSRAYGLPRKANEWGLRSQVTVPANRKLDFRLRGLELHFGRSQAVQVDELLLAELCEPAGTGLFIKPSKIHITLGIDRPWHRCSNCTLVFAQPIRGKCPECAHESLAVLDPETNEYLRARKNFWRDPVINILAGREKPFTVDVQEHTAQLGYVDRDDTSSTTEQYERRFRDILVSPEDAPIDVLSSTTTMEVGVDIGSLVAVGLHNVPPMRQNYQQRAGRAGRRGSAVSTVITYAQNGAHDSYYFKNPTEIISGPPPLPSVDVLNPRIAIRHVHAALIQGFFHERMLNVTPSGDVFSALGRAADFFSDKNDFTLKAFRDWLGSTNGNAYCDAVQGWIPDGLTLRVHDVATDFPKLLDEAKPAPDSNASLLDHLFEEGLLPTYAFPRSLCALQIEHLGPAGPEIDERPQQALHIALSEYSPGRNVVVNKKTYRIGSVTADVPGVVNRAEPLFADATKFIHCDNCGYTREPTGNAGAPTCPLCNAAELREVDVIQPEVVFPDGRSEVDEFDDDPVFTYATSAQYPAPANADEFTWRDVGINGKYVSAANQSLIVVNKGLPADKSFSGFNVCGLCGTTASPGEILTSPHERNYFVRTFGRPMGHNCQGTARLVYLGFRFSSDLLLLRVQIKRPLIKDLEHPTRRKPLANALLSLSEALVLSACQLLDVDNRELGGGVRFVTTDAGPVADMFIYDTATGGAGYAHMAGKRLSDIFERTRALLTDCTCDSSCRKCLRHYGNRFAHVDLDRRLALALLNYLEKDELPPALAHERQVATLQPLSQMLQLSGISTSSKPDAPLVASRGRKAIQIGTIPGLLDKRRSGHPLQARGLLFSDFELEKNLPGAFSEVMTALT